MTTIVFRDGVMASDGKGSCGDLAVELGVKKISVSIKHQFIAGHAGDPTVANQIFRALDRLNKLPWEDANVDMSFADLDGSGVIIAHKDGRMIQICNIGWFEMSIEPFYVIGSGTPVAMGALHMGASAEQAIEAACVYDNNSGGKARSVALDDIPPRPVRKSRKKSEK